MLLKYITHQFRVGRAKTSISPHHVLSPAWHLPRTGRLCSVCSAQRHEAARSPAGAALFSCWANRLPDHPEHSAPLLSRTAGSHWTQIAQFQSYLLDTSNYTISDKNQGHRVYSKTDAEFFTLCCWLDPEEKVILSSLLDCALSLKTSGPQVLEVHVPLEKATKQWSFWTPQSRLTKISNY